MDLRLAFPKDLDRMLEIRNQEKNRLSSLNNQIISKEQHYEWFDKYKAQNKGVIFMIEEQGQSIGILRLDRYEKAMEVSICLDESWTCKGFGEKAISSGVYYVSQVYPEIKVFTATILRRNLRSIAFFSKMGFINQEVEWDATTVKMVMTLPQKQTKE